VQANIQQHLIQAVSEIRGQAVDETALSVHHLASEAYDPSVPPVTGLDSRLQVPLLAGDNRQFIGLLFLASERPGAFSADHTRLVYTVAAQTAISIQRLQAVLAAEQRYLASLVEHLPEGVLLLDAERRIILANSTAQALLPALSGVGVGQQLTRLAGQPAEALFDAASNQLAQELVLADPRRRIFSLQVRRLEAGSLAGGWVVALRDVTEERERQQNVQQQERLAAVGQLAAGIAHEINTPTQYIGTNVWFCQESLSKISRALEQYEAVLEAARLGSVPPQLLAEVSDSVSRLRLPQLLEDTSQAIQDAQEGVERVSRIVQAMREFSHPSVDEKTPTDINRAIETTLTVARNEWKYVADVETDFDPDLPLVPCLPGDFNQVILNIVINAAHAIADVVEDGAAGKGTIGVRTRRDGDWAEIRISDTGTGIPENIRARIFEPFFTTKEVGKGTGQGLAISHAMIVRKHAGTITFETEPGKGTTFIIRLPLAGEPDGEGVSYVG
jgi:signal transduction histidine kinase